MSRTVTWDPTGKVFCLLVNEPFMFDPFQLKSIREITQSEPGTREDYLATQLSWIDGSWTVLKTSFDEVVEAVEAISDAWKQRHDDSA